VYFNVYPEVWGAAQIVLLSFTAQGVKGGGFLRSTVKRPHCCRVQPNFSTPTGQCHGNSFPSAVLAVS